MRLAMKRNSSLQRMLSALAYAHAGDYLSLRQKARVLSSQSPKAGQQERLPAPSPAETSPQHKRIALYLGSELPAETLEYVSQTCLRLECNLIVFTLQDAATCDALIAPLRARLEAAGHTVHCAPIRGEPEQALAAVLRRHPEVAFLVCHATGYLGPRLLARSGIGAPLPVPVVLISITGQAVGLPGHEDTQAKMATRVA